VERLQRERHLTVLLVRTISALSTRGKQGAVRQQRQSLLRCSEGSIDPATLEPCTQRRRSFSCTGMVKSQRRQVRRLSMTEAGTVYSVILAFLFAVAAGLVGSFALMKRMILAADVISHVALPGLA